jgi:hypothetical protein
MSKPIDTSKLGPPIKFYNNTITLRFSEDEWTYYLVGEDGSLTPQDGVTKIVHIIEKPHLIPWAAKMVYVKMLQTMPRHLKVLGNGEEEVTDSIPWTAFEQILLAAKNAHRDRLEDAGDVGSMAHSWLESTILNAITFNDGIVDKMNDMAPVDERAVSCGNDAFKWMQAHNIRWTSSERKVYSRKHGYAGTCDGTAIADSCSDPECCPNLYSDMPVVVDFKSSNYMDVTYIYQVGSYWNAITEETGDKFDAMWILKLGKEDGKFSAWFWNDFDRAFGGYMNCLNLSRSHHAMVQTLADAQKLVSFKRREDKKLDTKERKLKLSWEKKSAKAAAKAAKLEE